MKILFIVPPEEHFIESYVTQKLDRRRELRQKLGILFVAGALREATGIVPRIIDCLAEGYDHADLARVIAAERPDLVGFSVLTFNLLDCLSAAESIKSVSPGTRICFGGFHTSLYPLETLSLPNVDYVVFGEGEITLAELVKSLAKSSVSDEELHRIDGLGFHNSRCEPVVNRPRSEIARLDDLPLPAHDLIDINKYTFVLAEESKVGAIQTSRGCPGKCVFCDIRLSRHRFRSEEHVLEEIKLLHGLGIKEFFAVDDTFTINRNRVIRLCKLLINENLGIKYKISSRIDRIDMEMLQYLKSSGCYRIHYGVESGSQKILDYLQKDINVEQIVRVAEMTRKAGIEVFAYMMIGIPTETLEDIKQTYSLVKRIMPDHVNYSICTPFPNTFLYEQLLEKKIIRDDYWLEFAARPNPAFRVRTMNEHFDDNRLRAMQDRALRSFYSSPRVILREIVKTKSIKQLLVKAKMGIRLLTPRSFR